MLLQLILMLQQWRIYSSVAQFLGFKMKTRGSEYIPADYTTCIGLNYVTFCQV
jgi:hypothetical protein